MPKFVHLLAGSMLLCRALTAQSAETAQVDSEARRRILLLPAVGSAPETGLQLGVAVLAVFDHGAARRRPSSITASAVRSMKNQLRFSVDAERWSNGNDWRVAFNGAWQRFPLPYFGVGPQTIEGAREVYTPRGVEATLTLQRRLSGPVFLTTGTRVVSTDIVSTEAGGILGAGTLPGSSGGRSVEASAGLLVDSRDNLFSPASGRLVQLTVSRADRSIGSEFGYTRLRADVREYLSAGAHTLALHALVHGTTAGASFDQVALVGGSDIMRGYVKGRYRDAWMAAAQAEYRTPFVRRFGAVLFAGAGTVDSTASRLARGRLLATYGAGLRFQLDRRQRTAVRLDVARGAEGASGLYIGFNQAF